MRTLSELGATMKSEPRLASYVERAFAEVSA
jgi:hypothetical protein